MLGGLEVENQAPDFFQHARTEVGLFRWTASYLKSVVKLRLGVTLMPFGTQSEFSLDFQFSSLIALRWKWPFGDYRQRLMERGRRPD